MPNPTASLPESITELQSGGVSLNPPTSYQTIEPSLLQGLLVCQRCGYGLYRTSTRTSQRTIYYYRCLGRDGYRHLKGAVCDNRPIRQDQLDAVVWQEIMRLLEDPSLLQAELDRRLHAAQTTDPLKRREDALRRDQARLTKSLERLLTGYQENLITLEELHFRMPELRKQQRANEAELQSLEMTSVDPTRNLRLVDTLAQFRTRLRARGNVLEVAECQRVLRLLVQEILVGRGQHHNPPFHSHAGFFARSEPWSSRKPQTARAQYWPTLSFAFTRSTVL